MTVEIHDDAEALARAAAEMVLREIRAGRKRLLLAGGTTPSHTYELVGRGAQPGDYKGVHIFFGDERAVPPDHVESNYRMVRRAWLDPARFPPERVHRIRGEIDPERAARLAEEDLRAVAGEPVGLDLALLGLGTDGHTASLFPGSEALAESLRLYVPAREGRRITGTYPLLNCVDRVVFLVSGASKAEAVRSALHDPPGTVPASLVQPRGGAATWLLDREAASLLD
ncbi:MAG TPA: 6-phosphogluconolactonase [Kofleriaceae bacterium]|nr:6-phosphogluconolactonase [Kofleriaceae bacterium]